MGQLWTVATGAPVFGGAVTVGDSDASTIVVGGYDGHVHMIGPGVGPEHRRVRLSPQTTDAVYATPFVLNSRGCIVATTAGQLWWIDMASGGGKAMKDAHMLGYIQAQTPRSSTLAQIDDFWTRIPRLR